MESNEENWRNNIFVGKYDEDKFTFEQIKTIRESCSGHLNSCSGDEYNKKNKNLDAFKEYPNVKV